jgi:hypothetical protein
MGKDKRTVIEWNREGDYHWGPLTWCAVSSYRAIGLMLVSGKGKRAVIEDYDYWWTGPVLRLHFGRFVVLCKMPHWLIRPHLTFTSTAGAVYYGLNGPEAPRPPGSGFWETWNREYGAVLHHGGDGGYDHASIHYGPQTHDSSTTKDWGCFLPWTQWQHVRKSFYGRDGEHVYDEPPKVWKMPGDAWEKSREAVKAVPQRCFLFLDGYDNEHIVARTRIEEMEWAKGTGRFKWLRWFVPNKVRRSLDLRFTKEVGSRKQSWKGGTLGHGIDMLDGAEMHEAAFRRYCLKEGHTFVAEVDPMEVVGGHE